MVDKFYSQRHFERVQQMENSHRGFNWVMSACVIALFTVLLGGVGHTEHESELLELKSAQTASYELYEPMDIQPAYGFYQFQDATSGWVLQGDIR